MNTYVEKLEAKNQMLEDSIRYASAIQRAMLPDESQFQTLFTDAFIMYKPRDVLSGDFYWIFPFKDQIYFAVGDCTGHGVPGALIYMAGSALLRQVILMEGLNDPALILEELDQQLTTLLNEHIHSEYRADGMDIAFCRYDRSTRKLYFSGAGRPLVLVRNGEPQMLSSDRAWIGYDPFGVKSMSTQCLDTKPGDMVYLFSDGYTDQFGGEKVKKFNRKRFLRMLSSIAELRCELQGNELKHAFRNWKGNQEQVDDVCVVGVRV